jgi:hypothetical protein
VLKKVCLDEGDRRAEVKEMMMKLEDVVRMYSRWAFQRQLLDRNTAARRLVGEVLLVHAVHLGKVCHVVEEDVDLDNPVHSNTRLGENTLDVLAAHLGLVRDAALDQVALGIGGDLTGDEDIGACNNGLCVGSSRRTRVSGVNLLNVRHLSGSFNGVYWTWLP